MLNDNKILGTKYWPLIQISVYKIIIIFSGMQKIFARHISGSPHLKKFCEGMDQTFYIRNNTFAKKQSLKKPIFSYKITQLSQLPHSVFFLFPNKIL